MWSIFQEEERMDAKKIPVMESDVLQVQKKVRIERRQWTEVNGFASQ